MKLKLLFPLILILLSQVLCVQASALGFDDVISDAALLMDAQTGQVLFSKNGSEKMFPASTTKILTGLLAAEKLDMESIATVSQSAIDIDEWDSTNIGLVAGEKMSVDELMYAMMLQSANDAANVLAEHTAESQSNFAAMMTERAKQAGAVSSRFTNAHGLSDPNHYTTAYDLAMITREAVKNPVFTYYFGAVSHRCPPTNKNPYQRSYTNHQSMLVESSGIYDPSVIGGKVGYTHESMHTMSTAATRDGRTLICVVMHSPHRNDKFTDTAALLDFGFNQFSRLTIPKESFPGFTTDLTFDGIPIGIVDFNSVKDFTALIHKDLNPGNIKMEYSHKYPFDKDEAVASRVTFTLETPYTENYNLLGEIRLAPTVTLFEQPASAFAFMDDLVSEWWFWPLVILIAAALAFVVLICLRQINAYRRMKRRRARIERLRKHREEAYFR